MTKQEKNANQIDELEVVIEALLSRSDIPAEISAQLDAETAMLLKPIERVIQLKEKYPGAPPPSSQQLLALKTMLRSQVSATKKDQHISGLKRLNSPVFRWAAAAVGILVLALLSQVISDLTTSGGLSAGAGGNGLLLPIAILAVAAVISILYFIKRKK
jgi:hypothetical protein